MELPKIRLGVPEESIVKTLGSADILLNRAKWMFANIHLEKQIKEVFRDQTYSVTRYAVTDHKVPFTKERAGHLYGVIAAVTQLFNEEKNGAAVIVFAKPEEKLIEVHGGNFKEAFSSDKNGAVEKLKELLLRAKENPGEIEDLSPRGYPVIRGHFFSLVIDTAPRLRRNS